MKIFLGWSGTKSQDVAQSLRDWLPKVIQSADPWMSEVDIEKGARWDGELAGQLEKANLGILCMTPENLGSRWIMFEAGALSKAMGVARVCPYLVGVESANIKGPLAQFQHTRANKEDTRKLLGTINALLGEKALPDGVLGETFEMWWPKLELKLQEIIGRSATQAAPRDGYDLLVEVLATVRELARSVSAPDSPAPRRYSLSDIGNISLTPPPLDQRDFGTIAGKLMGTSHPDPKAYMDPRRSKSLPVPPSLKSDPGST